MRNTKFSTATNAIEAFGATAHSAIDAYRTGGERLGELAGQRWTRAFRQASPKLTEETRKNATHARKVIGGYYSRGIDLSARGAGTAVDTLVKVTGSALQRAKA